MTKTAKTARALISLLTRLGVNMPQMPLVVLDQVCQGKAMVIVARKLKCSDCGRRHRVAFGYVAAVGKHPRKLFVP
jgi:hypothetical protein